MGKFFPKFSYTNAPWTFHHNLVMPIISENFICSGNLMVWLMSIFTSSFHRSIRTFISKCLRKRKKLANILAQNSIKTTNVHMINAVKCIRRNSNFNIYFPIYATSLHNSLKKYCFLTTEQLISYHHLPSLPHST